MRILLVTDERGTPTIPGGGLNHLMYVARPATALGHTVDFLTADEFRGKYINSAIREMISNKLKNKIRDFNPDIINFFNNCIWGLESFTVCDELGVPNLLTSPDYAPVCKTRMLLWSKNMKRFCDLDGNCADCVNQRAGIAENANIVEHLKDRQIIVASNFLRDMYIKGGFKPENIEMIEYGLNPDAFKPSYGGNSGEIMNITRMSPEKGIDLYVGLSKLVPELKWKLAGYPNIGYEGFEGIEYVGEITEREKLFYIKNSEMFVSTPRWYEPVGGTYLESKALGRPIVTFALGGIPQYHSDGGAVLVEFPKLEVMAEKVRELHKDEDLRIRLGKEGRKQIEERNNENILIHHTLKIYDKVRGTR